MRNTPRKIVIAVVVLSGILFINFAILAWIYPKFNQGKINTTPFAPPINTPTASPQPEGVTATNGPTKSPLPLRDLSSACVNPAAYWSGHPEDWPAQIKIGSLTFSKGDALAALKVPVKDIYGYLTDQMITAYLNNANITPSASAVQSTTEAAAWLNAHPVGANLTDSDRQAGLTIGLNLENYNNGKIDAGLCAGDATDVPFTQENPAGAKVTPTMVIIPATLPPVYNPLPTLKPTQTKTHTPPTATRTATSRQPTATATLKPTVIPPTDTIPPPASPTAAPTATQLPPPTATPLPLPSPAPTATP